MYDQVCIKSRDTVRSPLIEGKIMGNGPFQVSDEVTMTQTVWRGFQVCPFDKISIGCKEEKGNRDFHFHSPRGSVTISELALHLIRKHRFFEGNVPYRIDLKRFVKYC